MAAAPELCYISTDLPEPAVCPVEPESVSVVPLEPEFLKPTSSLVLSSSESSSPLTAFNPESVLTYFPKNILGRETFIQRQRFASSVDDPPLVSVRTAGIPKPTHSSPSTPEVIPSATLPVMGLALWCVWATYTTAEYPEVVALVSAPGAVTTFRDELCSSFELAREADYEPLPCPKPAMKIISEPLFSCPETASEAVNELSSCVDLATVAIFQLPSCSEPAKQTNKQTNKELWYRPELARKDNYGLWPCSDPIVEASPEYSCDHLPVNELLSCSKPTEETICELSLSPDPTTEIIKEPCLCPVSPVMTQDTMEEFPDGSSSLVMTKVATNELPDYSVSIPEFSELPICLVSIHEPDFELYADSDSSTEILIEPVVFPASTRRAVNTMSMFYFPVFLRFQSLPWVPDPSGPPWWSADELWWTQVPPKPPAPPKGSPPQPAPPKGSPPQPAPPKGSPPQPAPPKGSPPQPAPPKGSPPQPAPPKGSPPQPAPPWSPPQPAPPWPSVPPPDPPTLHLRSTSHLDYIVLGASGSRS
ncbi:hypothetical protein PO909_009933 [Leuciscus waleckii]